MLGSDIKQVIYIFIYIGRGIIALRDFEVGELILNEQPMIRLPMSNNQSMAPVVELLSRPKFSVSVTDFHSCAEIFFSSVDCSGAVLQP